jgi:hypothetical protein
VLTCGVGNESYSLLDIPQSESLIRNIYRIVYNYGAFDFNTPNFAKFIKETYNILQPILTLTL